MANFFDTYKKVQPEHKTVFASLIYGPPKIGKTTLAISSNELGRTVLLNFEGRSNHIPQNENLIIYPTPDTVCTEEDIRKLIAFCHENKDHGIKYLIIDTVDALFENMEYNYYQNVKTFTLSQNERKRITVMITDLFKIIKYDLKINLIMTSHEKRDEDNIKTIVGLSPKLKININQKTDFIFYMNINSNGERILITQPRFNVEAGQSMPIGQELPSEILNPTWKTIFGEK